MKIINYGSISETILQVQYSKHIKMIAVQKIKVPPEGANISFLKFYILKNKKDQSIIE